MTGTVGWRAPLAILFFLVSTDIAAASVSGVVLDPQGLSIEGARVAVVCGEDVETASSDAKGRFTIRAATDDCLITVAHEGFALFRQALTDAADPLVIRLAVAPLAEHVNVVGRSSPPPHLGSVTLDAREHNLRAFAASTSDLIHYAQSLAGASTRPVVVYVDGLPGMLPPLDAIAQISINGDPFSAEHAHGGAATVEIITKAPARTLRFLAGGDIPAVEGKDVLAPALATTSRSVNLGLTGPVPGVPLTFSVSAGRGRMKQETPIRAVFPELDRSSHAALVENRSHSASLGIYYALGTTLRGRVLFRESRDTGVNVGVGGITLPEAGWSSELVMRDSRASVTKGWTRALYEGGIAVTDSRSEMRANDLTRGISIGGDVVMGGSSISSSRRKTTRWTVRQVIRSRSSRPWTIGVVASGSAHANSSTPNAGGTFHFADADAYRAALSGERTGIWFVTRGEKLVRFRTVNASPFAHAELLGSRWITVGGGVRADYQSGFGVLMSPRLSLAARWRGATVRAGAGLFVQSLPESIFIDAIEKDGRRLQQFVASAASLVEPPDALLPVAAAIRSRLADDLTRTRSLMWRVSVERRFAGVLSAVEYSASDGRRLLGSDRVSTAAGWADVFESNRRSAEQRLHAHVRRSWNRVQFLADYELTRARDNTDGPFSFPEQPGNLAAEWARSTGVAPHSVTLMSSLSLPGAVSLNVSDTWRSGAPFNVTTGSDTAGNGLILDRGGRTRNSGDGPAFHSVSLYLHRRLEMPRILRAPRGTGVNVSVQVDNVLDNRNYLSVGSVARSATFGMPLAAYPGRSIRVIMSVD